jgi:hypothetical protein
VRADVVPAVLAAHADGQLGGVGQLLQLRGSDVDPADDLVADGRDEEHA